MHATPPLIITGMPRCGIEMTATAFFDAGLYLGGPLIPPDAAGLCSLNGRAGAEEVARFHDDMVAAAHQRHPAPVMRPPICPPDRFRGGAERLLQSLSGGREAWGWRDGRSVLMLEAWHEVVPDARWIFVIRPSAETVWSMLWHGELKSHIAAPVPRALAALGIWTAYHRAIRDFARHHPGQVQLVVVPRDFEESPQDLNDVLTRRWALPMRPVDLETVYRKHQLIRTAPSWIGRLAAAYAPARRIWSDLIGLRAAKSARPRAAAGVPSARSERGMDTPAVCVATIRKGAYPETFIRDHIHWLPTRVDFVHGKKYPTLTSDDLPLRTRRERLLSAFFDEFGVESVWPWQRAFRRYLQRSGVSVVLAEFGPVGAQVLDACEEADVPLVVHFHGFDVSRKAVLEEHRESYRRMFGRAAGFIGVSHDMEQQLLSLGAPRERLFYNPCGVNTSIFRGARPDTAPPHFLCAGRFVEKKGPHLTLLAFQQVARACPEARLTMIGDGLLRAACEQMTASMKLQDRVTFIGVRPHTEIAAHMRNARCFVQHSLTGIDGNAEGTPVALSEAGASGLPVVSTLHAGIKDAVVNGESGFLVAEGDIDGMASHMIRLANDPGLAARMGARAREHIVANYSMERTSARLWEILQWAIAQHRLGPRRPVQ